MSPTLATRLVACVSVLHNYRMTVSLLPPSTRYSLFIGEPSESIRCRKTVLFSLGLSHSMRFSLQCELREALYKSIDTVQYNTYTCSYSVIGPFIC